VLKKIELVSEKKMGNKTLIKIKGGACICANCVCSTMADDTWRDEKAGRSKVSPDPAVG